MTDIGDALQTQLGPTYTVERELGGGGMSRVFVAFDKSLGRRVAVKVVSPELAASVPVLVDFWAPWCGPCRMIAPIVQRLADRHAGQLKLIKLNVDQSPNIAGQYGAMSIPLLVLFRDGREDARQVGAVSEAQLTAWLEPQLATEKAK